MRIAHSDEFRDFICKLLDKSVHTRLGAQGDEAEVKAHDWLQEFDYGDKHFSSIDFEALETAEKFRIPYWCFERTFNL